MSPEQQNGCIAILFIFKTIRNNFLTVYMLTPNRLAGACVESALFKLQREFNDERKYQRPAKLSSRISWNFVDQKWNSTVFLQLI